MTPLDSRIDEDFVCRLYRGEPFVFEGQLEDADGAVESLDGRTFWGCVMASDGTRLHEVVAEILTDRERPYYRGVFDGSMTEERFGQSGLLWSQGEHVASLGRKIHAQGLLIIYPGPGFDVPTGTTGIAAIAHRIVRREKPNGRTQIRISQQGARGPGPWEPLNQTREEYQADLESLSIATARSVALEHIDPAITELGEVTSQKIGELDAVKDATEAARIAAQAQANAIGNIAGAVAMSGANKTASENARDLAIAAAAPVAAAAGSINATRGGMELQTIGRSSITSTTTVNGANAGTFTFVTPAVHTSRFTKLRARNIQPVAITVQLRRSKVVNGEVVPGAGADWQPVVIPAGPGNFEIDISFLLKRGELWSISVPTVGRLGYETPVTGDSGGYYYNAAVQPAGAIPAGTVQAIIQLQVGIDGLFALAADDAAADTTANAAAVAAVGATAVANDKALSQITSRELAAVGTPRNYTGVGAFAPGSGGTAFYEWAIGVISGENIPVDAIGAGIRTKLNYDASTARIEACLFSRPKDASFINAVPGNAGDRQEWTSWQSVAPGALGFSAGAFGDYTWVSPAGQAPAAATKSFYLLLRAFDADNNRVPIGCGNGGAVAGAAGILLGRGFYRQGLATNGWTALNSTTSSLAVAVFDYRYSVAGASTSASSRPSKTKGLVIYGGRMELPVTVPAGGVTQRRIFSVPANVKRVRRVIFAHATTTPLTITRAAIAPLTSVANFAAAGAVWTALKFGSAKTEGRVVPAAAGSQRIGWSASIDNPVELLARTDVIGGAKLVCVSAYLGTTGTPTLLGKAGTDDYKANWEARSDFPMVMRSNDGDCVTTPASFASTTNLPNGTAILGIEVETDDGELLTIGGSGDSITNGAGISAGGVVLYGLGWLETLVYSFNTKRRGACPVLLGWSGISMQGIRNLAVDFYAFCKAEGLAAPNVWMTPNASPNSMGTPLLDAQMTAQRTLLDEIIGTVLGAGSQVVKWLCLPVDPTTKDLDPSTDPNDGDKFRRNYNDADRAEANALTGMVTADYDTAVTLGFDSDAQALFNDDYEDDGIHPNAAGHSVLRAVGIRAVRAVLAAAGFALGGLIA